MFKIGEHEVICKTPIPRKRIPSIVPSLEYEWKVIKDGKVLKSGKGKAHSYVLNFMKLLRILFYATGETLKDDTGSDITVQKSNLPDVDIAPDADIDTYGILFGTGTTGFDINQYNLASKIPQGTGDNQFDYGAVSVGEVDTSTPNKIRMAIQRSAVNNGSVDINVNEVGLFIKITIGGTDYYFMLARDKLDSTITVPAGATLSWTYYIYTAY